MPLREKLSEEDLSLAMIIEDPIWIGEFLRSTNDGETDRALWPKKEFKYRWFQRDFLSDKNEFILFTGGRAIGKCQPTTSKVLTPHGYKTITQLKKSPYFITYGLDEDLQLVQRRAVITKDKNCPVFSFQTETGHRIHCTKNHPILTPTGYKLAGDLGFGDLVAVATYLPNDSQKQALQWHELRWLGYVMLEEKIIATMNLKPRFKQQAPEIEQMATDFMVLWHKTGDGSYVFERRKGPFRHPINSLLKQCMGKNPLPWQNIQSMRYIPEIVMEECSSNVKVFLEALYSQFGELSANKISLYTKYKAISLQIQELLLRFGIESKIVTVDRVYCRLDLLDYRAIYRFWNTFSIPGVEVGKLPLPPESTDPHMYYRWEPVVDITYESSTMPTYAIHVYDTNNYISENIHVHNSIVLEDRTIHNVLNSDIEFPVTSEQSLVTANQSQMTPLLDRIISRFSGSPLLKHFLKNNVNRQRGTLDFPGTTKGHRLNARIAGSKGEQNMVNV